MQSVDPRINPALVPAGSQAIVCGERQPEYVPLPAIYTPDGKIITRWTFSDEERKQILCGEDLFLTILSEGPIHPVILTVGPVNWNVET